MTDQIPDIQARSIKSVNWVGVFTLMQREIARFLNVFSQTIIAPVITTLLFYAIFSLAFGQARGTVMGLDFMAFLTPGLVMMSMAQNAFANTSSSIVIAKVQGNIVDVLMAPLSAWEVVVGFMVGGVVRAIIIGFVSVLVLAFVADIKVTHLWAIITFGVLGGLMLSLLGIMGGIWSQKFDHLAAVTNFIITPLTFLSGTFYTMDVLSEPFASIGSYNPFFFMIDGFRYGFIGISDGNILHALIGLVCVNCVLIFTAYLMLKSGYKMKS